MEVLSTASVREAQRLYLESLQKIVDHLQEHPHLRQGHPDHICNEIVEGRPPRLKYIDFPEGSPQRIALEEQIEIWLRNGVVCEAGDDVPNFHTGEFRSCAEGERNMMEIRDGPTEAQREPAEGG